MDKKLDRMKLDRMADYNKIKKIGIIFFGVILILVIFMLGCKPETSQVGQVIKTETSKQTIPETEEQIFLPPELVLLFEKNSNVKSMQYIYVTSFDPAMNKYFVKGDGMKIELMKPVYNKTVLYDTIYLNLSSKEAKAYCERDDDCYKIKEAYDVSFAYYFKKTPLDWVEKLKEATNFTKISTEIVENKKSIHYSFMLNNKSGEVWIWEYYGLPLKIILDGKTYEFRTLAVNSLSDNDVTK